MMPQTFDINVLQAAICKFSHHGMVLQQQQLGYLSSFNRWTGLAVADFVNLKSVTEVCSDPLHFMILKIESL